MQNDAAGSWSGKIVHNKKEISLDNDSFIGTRDRSWGVRPVGAYDSQPMVPFSMPQFYWLWAPIHFDDSAAHIYFVEERVMPAQRLLLHKVLSTKMNS